MIRNILTDLFTNIHLNTHIPICLCLYIASHLRLRSVIRNATEFVENESDSFSSFSLTWYSGGGTFSRNLASRSDA